MGLLDKISAAVFGEKSSSETSRKSHYFIYPRNKEGKRTGQTLCVLMHDGRIFHGMSTCSNDDQFCKTTGRNLALTRAQQCVERYERRKALSS